MAGDLSEKYDIYDVNFDDASFENLYRLYAEVVIPNANTSEVVSCLVEYVTSVIEPVGWKAIWKIPKQRTEDPRCFSGCEFLVEVHDVSMKKLEASVDVLDLLSRGDPCEGESDMADGQWLVGQTDVDVPLTHLFPLRDKEAMFLQTARAIHTVRFFYENIWRPWDDDDDEGNFVERHLEARLKFYFERISGSLPVELEHRARELLTEAADIQAQLEDLQSHMTLSDSEEELEEEDLRACVNLRTCMESLQREMEILENPLIRNLVSKKSQPERQVHRDEAVVHIVSKKLTLGLIKSLSLSDDTILEVHSNVEDALCSSISGDTVLILPGHYKMGTIPWLEKDLTVRGQQEQGPVVLEAGDGCGDLFLSCSAQSLTLSNLQLVPSPGMLATVFVHGGCLTIDHCILRGAKSAMVILETSQVQLNHSQITGSQGDSVQLRAGSKCSLISCCIQDCEGSALRVSSNDQLSRNRTCLTLEDCQITNNSGFGLLVECVEDVLVSEESVTWEKLKRIPLLDLHEVSSVITGNGRGDFGICPQDTIKCSSTATTSSPEEQNHHYNLPVPRFPDLNDSDEY